MRINVNVSEELNDWLELRSEQIGVPKSSVIAIALQDLKENTEKVQLEKYLVAISNAEIAMYHPDAEVKKIKKKIIAEKLRCKDETGFVINEIEEE